MRYGVLVVVIIGLLFYSGKSNAQQKDTITHKAYYKHEIGYIIPFGGLYKYHFKKNAFRFIINYKPGGLYKADGACTNYGKTIRIKFGYQYAIIDRKFKLYVGADIAGVYSKDHTDTSSISPKYNNTSIGLSPFIGIGYQFHRRFSASLEVASGFLYTWYSPSPNGYYRNSSESSYYSSQYLYSVSVNISYHF